MVNPALTVALRLADDVVDAIVAVVVIEVELDGLERDVAVEDVVGTIVVAKVAVVEEEDDVGDVVVEVVLVEEDDARDVKEEVVLAVDVDTGVGSVAADVDLDASVSASTGGTGAGTCGGTGGGKAVRTGEIVKVDVVFKEDVAEFCVFSSITEMRRFAKRQTDGEIFSLVLLTA